MEKKEAFYYSEPLQRIGTLNFGLGAIYQDEPCEVLGFDANGNIIVCWSSNGAVTSFPPDSVRLKARVNP